MPPSLLRPQDLSSLTPAEILELARRAPEILRDNPRAHSASRLRFLFSAPETTQLWTVYETLMLSCLRTGDDEVAHECLERLANRFGHKDERVLALRGLAKEAIASDDGELERILDEYELILQENGTNIPLHKRKVALLRSMNRLPESITALKALLNFNSTDAEAWAELADMYLSLGLYPQAIYALEEVLVLMPNAWNMHARLGEVYMMAADTHTGSVGQKHLAEAVRRFCRSIELCDDYLRGYFGLTMATDKLMGCTPASKKQQPEAEGLGLPEKETIERLNQAATKKLAEIVRRYQTRDKLWQGYKAGEIAAARKLLGDARLS